MDRIVEKEASMIELTEQQQQALDSSPNPQFIDPRTQKAYFLVGAEIYERIQGIVTDDDVDMQQVAVLVKRAMREEDAGDSTLEYYQREYGGKR
jgi:hypothetical protein